MRGTSVRPRAASKGCPTPGSTCDQLEGAGRDFSAGTGDADNDRFAPPLVAGFECGAHYVDVANALKGVIGAASGQIHEVGDKVTTHIIRIHEMGHSEPFAPCLLGVVQIHTHDHVGANKPQPLHDI